MNPSYNEASKHFDDIADMILDTSLVANKMLLDKSSLVAFKNNRSFFTETHFDAIAQKLILQKSPCVLFALDPADNQVHRANYPIALAIVLWNAANFFTHRFCSHFEETYFRKSQAFQSPVMVDNMEVQGADMRLCFWLCSKLHYSTEQEALQAKQLILDKDLEAFQLKIVEWLKYRKVKGTLLYHFLLTGVGVERESGEKRFRVYIAVKFPFVRCGEEDFLQAESYMEAHLLTNSKHSKMAVRSKEHYYPLAYHGGPTMQSSSTSSRRAMLLERICTSVGKPIPSLKAIKERHQNCNLQGLKQVDSLSKKKSHTNYVRDNLLYSLITSCLFENDQHTILLGTKQVEDYSAVYEKPTNKRTFSQMLGTQESEQKTSRKKMDSNAREWEDEVEESREGSAEEEVSAAGTDTFAAIEQSLGVRDSLKIREDSYLNPKWIQALWNKQRGNPKPDLTELFSYLSGVAALVSGVNNNPIIYCLKVVKSSGSFTQEFLKWVPVSKTCFACFFAGMYIKSRSVFSIWMGSVLPKYMDVTFTPRELGENEADSTFNLFRGYLITREIAEDFCGDEHYVDMFLEHLRETICGGNENVFKSVLMTLAAKLQNPAYNHPRIIVAKGDQDTGKSTIWSIYGAIIGECFNELRYEYGNEAFNGASQELLVEFWEEFRFPVSKKEEVELQRKVTASQTLVKKKWVSEYFADNCKLHLAACDPRSIKDDDKSYVISEKKRFWILPVKASAEGRLRAMALREMLVLGNFAALCAIALYLYRVRVDYDYIKQDLPEYKKAILREVSLAHENNTVVHFWGDCIQRGYHVIRAKCFKIELALGIRRERDKRKMPYWFESVPRVLIYQEYLDYMLKTHRTRRVPYSEIEFYNITNHLFKVNHMFAEGDGEPLNTEQKILDDEDGTLVEMAFDSSGIRRNVTYVKVMNRKDFCNIYNYLFCTMKVFYK